jgi:hypothetical protein
MLQDFLDHTQKVFLAKRFAQRLYDAHFLGYLEIAIGVNMPPAGHGDNLLDG